MKTEQLTDNEVIAEFMGVPKLYENGKTLWDTSGSNKLIYALPGHCLQYRTSWDWLMSVVEKIESYGYTVTIQKSHCGVKGVYLTQSSIGASKIESVHKAVVEFIKWYNQQKK